MVMVERVEAIYQDVVKRNPGEVEFHQAVKEVLECLGPVLVKYPDFTEAKIIDTLPANISVWIDGFKVPRPERFFTGPSGSQSPIFNIHSPPESLDSTERDAPELGLTPVLSRDTTFS